MSAGFVARTTPAHAIIITSPGSVTTVERLNWDCRVGLPSGVTLHFYGPFTYGWDWAGWHANMRIFTYTYNCNVTLTNGGFGGAGGLGSANSLIGSGRAYGVGVITDGLAFHTTAHVAIFGTLDNIIQDAWSFNVNIYESDVFDPLAFANTPPSFFYHYGLGPAVVQRGQITSGVGTFTGAVGTGYVSPDGGGFGFPTFGLPSNDASMLLVTVWGFPFS
jgi:hypothetical protein